jgi:CheY-like chemotaxis protein
MAAVLVVESDADVRCVLAEALRDDGHIVTSMANACLALAMLWFVERPLVVLLDAHLAPLSGVGLLELAYDDESGRLLRHGYILMTTAPSRLEAKHQRLLARMAVPLLPLPFDLDEFSALVAQTAVQAQTQQIRVAPLDEYGTGDTATRIAADFDPHTLAVMARYAAGGWANREVRLDDLVADIRAAAVAVGSA